MKALKIIAIIALVGVLVGLAYVQALFSNQGSDKDDSNPPPISKQENDFVKSDRYGELIDSLREFYIDSLSAFSELVQPTESIYVSDLDSAVVNGRYDSLMGEISQLSQELDSANDKMKKYDADNRMENEKLVYRFYSREMTSLPADLTDYERSVSIKEIKDKAKMYFNVSSGQLEEIVKKYKK